MKRFRIFFLSRDVEVEGESVEINWSQGTLKIIGKDTKVVAVFFGAMGFMEVSR